MNTKSSLPMTIDSYISSFPKEVQKILTDIRTTIHDAAPDATEKISYMMPTFALQGKNLIHFAAYASHIGIYPTGADIESEIPEVAPFRTGKGTLQFPLSDPFPHDLLKKLVHLRMKQIEKKTL